MGNLADQLTELSELIKSGDLEPWQISARFHNIIQEVESMEDNMDGVEDERNVYLAWIEASGYNIAAVTRVGRQLLSGKLRILGQEEV